MTFIARAGTFEGPLDLLLQLVEAAKLDLSSVSLAQVTEAFLREVRAYVESERFPVEELASFLVVASKLVTMKARLLVPTEEPLEEEDTLVERLRAYQAFVRAGELLRRQMDTGTRFFSRGDHLEEDLSILPLSPSIERLAKLYRELLAREQTSELPSKTLLLERLVSLEARMQDLGMRLTQEARFLWSSWVPSSAPRELRFVSFLAVLELLRTQKLSCEQEELFGDILLSRV